MIVITGGAGFIGSAMIWELNATICQSLRETSSSPSWAFQTRRAFRYGDSASA